jgi:hypothetical protein
MNCGSSSDPAAYRQCNGRSVRPWSPLQLPAAQDSPPCGSLQLLVPPALWFGFHSPFPSACWRKLRHHLRRARNSEAPKHQDPSFASYVLSIQTGTLSVSKKTSFLVDADRTVELRVRAYLGTHPLVQIGATKAPVSSDLKGWNFATSRHPDESARMDLQIRSCCGAVPYRLAMDVR